MRVLTGPAAAAVRGLDGFRDIEWSALYCAPMTCRPAPGLVRTRQWKSPLLLDDVALAHPLLMLRHLAIGLQDEKPSDGISIRDRVELAMEHAIRIGLVTHSELRIRGSRSVGDRVLREVLDLRGDQTPEEPPTESYAETRALQILRSWGIGCFRQVWVYERGRPKHRVDLVIPFDQNASRPERLTSGFGLILEVDSREFHEGRFQEDHERQTTYDYLGLDWMSFTPTQLERRRNRERQAFETTFNRARNSHRLKSA
jgi:hypothetical protein